MTLRSRVTLEKETNPTLCARNAAKFLALSICLAGGMIAISAANKAECADFAHSQKVYVPPTAYDRRVDFSSIREQYTLPQATQAKKSSPASKKNTTAKPAAAKTPGQKAAVKTLVKESSLPPPALNGKAASGQSLSEIARSLSSKVPPSAIAKMKQTAIDLQKSGKLDEAQRVLTKIAQLSPEDKANLQQVAAVGVKRARNYLKSNNFQDALLAARQALAASPGDPEANTLLAQLYQKVGADPNDVHSRLKTASSLLEQGRLHEAEVEYKASLAVRPTADAHIGLGKVAEKMHGAGSGKQHFEHALELDSNHAAAHRELGATHLKKGDLVSANSELSRALVLDPQDKEASKHLLNLWQTQVSKIPNANSHLGLARAHQLSGDLASAQAEYREVVRLDPNHPYLPAARQSFKIALAKQEGEKAATAARTLQSQGLVSEAYQKISEAVAYSPGNSNYKLLQGELLEKLGQQGQAKQVYMNVLKDDPQNQTAAQKIKQLSNLAAATADGLSAAGLAQALLPGGAQVSRHPAGFPGSKFPGTLLNPGVSAGTIAAANGAPVDHVGILSNFMGDVRNHMLVQNEKNKQLEDAAHKIIKQLTAPPEEEAAAGGAGAKAAESDQDIINKILSGPSPQASASTSAAESGAASALAGAAAALAAVKNQAGVAPEKSPAPTQTSNSKQSKTKSAGTANKTTAAPKAASDQKIADLEEQNRQLQGLLQKLSPQTSPVQTAPHAAPLGSMDSPFESAAPATAPAAPSGGLSQMYAAPGSEALSSQMPAIPQAQGQSIPMLPYNGSLPSNYGTPQAVPQAQGQAIPMVPYNGSLPTNYGTPQAISTGVEGLSGQMPPIAAPALANNAQSIPMIPYNGSMPAGYGAPQQVQTGLRGPIAANQAIKFELKNIKPTLKDVQLKVSLRNDGNAALAIPENLQAVIKYNNQTESELKIAFEGKSVAPHSTVDGVVKVPFNKVDPTADLVLRNLLPTNQELHIIKTAITQNPM